MQHRAATRRTVQRDAVILRPRLSEASAFAAFAPRVAGAALATGRVAGSARRVPAAAAGVALALERVVVSARRAVPAFSGAARDMFAAARPAVARGAVRDVADVVARAGVI